MFIGGGEFSVSFLCGTISLYSMILNSKSQVFGKGAISWRNESVMFDINKF
jgi:hypothetical protein